MPPAFPAPGKQPRCDKVPRSRENRGAALRSPARSAGRDPRELFQQLDEWPPQICVVFLQCSDAVWKYPTVDVGRDRRLIEILEHRRWKAPTPAQARGPHGAHNR